MAHSAAAASRNLGEGERIASGVGGAVLLGYGLARRPSPVSALYAAAGVLLLERGLTGHCSIYEALGLDRSAPRARSTAVSDRESILDAIERASEASFPASDPPAWGPMTAGHHARMR